MWRESQRRDFRPHPQVAVSFTTVARAGRRATSESRTFSNRTPPLFARSSPRPGGGYYCPHGHQPARAERRQLPSGGRRVFRGGPGIHRPRPPRRQGGVARADRRGVGQDFRQRPAGGRRGEREPVGDGAAGARRRAGHGDEGAVGGAGAGPADPRADAGPRRDRRRPGAERGGGVRADGQGVRGGGRGDGRHRRRVQRPRRISRRRDRAGRNRHARRPAREDGQPAPRRLRPAPGRRSAPPPPTPSATASTTASAGW